MDVQTTVLRDGQWVTETVDIQSVLKTLAPKPQKKPRPLNAPVCGLLTRTIIESELVHFILPVHLRSPHHNDVAFVGDHFVQIRELRPDGQFQDIIRKNDFGSRIRNAVVIGSTPDNRRDEDWAPVSLDIKSEEGDSSMHSLDECSTGTPPVGPLPPQMLVLVLECGDTVFLYLPSRPFNALKFEHATFVSPKNQLVLPGFHLAVDPSSRYLTLGCAQRWFVVYELESLESLEERSRRGEPLTPVSSYRLRSVQGVIHKMEFLHPRPGDDQHIILLLIVVRNGKSRMVTYEWELGDDLKGVFAEEKNGHRMPVENQMPLLLIPLKVSSAFIAISEEQIAVCTQALHGPPNFESFNIPDRPATDNYHGQDEPLWTAWARPYRLPDFFTSNDCIYLAREDGVVYFVEADAESTLTGSVFMDKFDCSISTAFACLYDQFTDVLVMGGDSGPGAIWKVPARQSLVPLGTLPNWSPVLDFTTTDEFSAWDQEVGATGNRMVSGKGRNLAKPDRVFSTSGRGTKGSITEYRYGHQAKIGLELECGLGVKQAWVLPVGFSIPLGGFDLLLSFPDRTTVLRLSEDLSVGTEIEDSLRYDTSCRTLSAIAMNDMVVQVTERNVVLFNGMQTSRLPSDKFGDLEHDTLIIDATICDEYIAISTHSHMRFQIFILRVQNAFGLQVATLHAFQVDAEVTCLSLCRCADDTLELMAGLWRGGRPILGRAQLGGAEDQAQDLEWLDPSAFAHEPDHGYQKNVSSAIDSIASCVQGENHIVVIGFRDGNLLTARLLKDKAEWQKTERLGSTAAKVIVGSAPGEKPMFLVYIDSELILMTDIDGVHAHKTGIIATKNRVWPMDVSNPAASSPAVDSVTVLPKNLITDRDGTVSLLLISGPRVLFAEMQIQPGQAHRHMPIDGTPTKIIYSHHLQCLVVAVTRKDRPTLMFMDPDTGDDLSSPTDKNGEQLEFVRGLGKPGDRIHGLIEWEHKKDNNIWRFILLSTAEGRMMILSAEREEMPQEDRPPKIRYFLRFKRKGLERPVYSVLGHEDVIIYCVGETIHWEVLDQAEKKLRPMGSYDLDSPATSLRVVNGKLLALTCTGSLEIISLPHAGGPTTVQLDHSDPRHRNAIHMIQVAGTPGHDPLSSLILVCDRDCGVVGLWVPWQAPGRDCEEVLEAELPASIRSFRRGRTRPPYDQENPELRFGRIPMTVDDAEILGVCMDGSLVHFTLLDERAWRLLRLIQDLAMRDPELCPFTDPAPEHLKDSDIEGRMIRPDLMHIDGDLLGRVLEANALEWLLTSTNLELRFIELVADVEEDSELTLGFEDDLGHHILLAYGILRYFLGPVL